MVNQQKIFITGVTSDIMQKLVQHLDNKKYKIYGLTRSLKSREDPEVQYVVGNIEEPEAFKDYLSNCSILIHAAAVTHSFRKGRYFEVNLDSTRRLIDLATQYDVKKVVYISSNTAGEKNGAYSLTKSLSEEYLKDNFKTWLILRPSEIYGGRKREGIENFISQLINKLIIFYPAGVPSKLYPIHVEDVAKIIYSVVFKEEMTNEKITICGSTGYSFSELVKIAGNLRRKNIIPVPVLKPWMFLIKNITERLPFFLGVIPDQITRLYSQKNIGSTMFRTGQLNFEEYLKERILSGKKITKFRKPFPD